MHWMLYKTCNTLAPKTMFILPCPGGRENRWIRSLPNPAAPRPAHATENSDPLYHQQYLPIPSAIKTNHKHHGWQTDPSLILNRRAYWFQYLTWSKALLKWAKREIKKFSTPFSIGKCNVWLSIRKCSDRFS